MVISELLQMPAHILRTHLRNGDFSVSELTRTYLEHIDKVNPQLNAICTLSETALEEAEALDKRQDKDQLPLLGLPVGIKDVTPVAGMRTTYGSPLYSDNIPNEDALVVSRLRAAGAIIMGKTNTPEFATGGNTFNDVFGPTRNPWNPNFSAGGSTGGGASALASGMIALAEGTDLGGSLRIPASFCGVVGLRPSAGLIPTYPSEFLWDNMQVTGPMARTVEDVALMLQHTAGSSELCPIYQPTEGRNFVDAVTAGLSAQTRVAYCPDIAGIGIDSEIEQICQSAAGKLDNSTLHVDQIPFDLSFAWDPFLAMRGYWMVSQQYRRLTDKDKFGPNLKGNVESGLATTMEAIGAAEQGRGKIWSTFREFFERYDYLLTPCMAVSPFPVEQNYPETIAGKEMNTYVDWIAPTFILSLSGLPVGCVPVGLTGDGLPVGIQVVGPQMGEEKVLALMKVIQESLPIGLPQMQ